MTDRQPIVFVTSNPNKAIEAERILAMPLLHADISLPEIQAATVEEITRYKLQAARSSALGRLIVEDVSLGLEALGGFPGPYVKWLLEAAGGGRGLAAVAYALNDRTAVARCCLGYWDGAKSHILVGEVRGTVLVEPQGEERFGWDPFFVPEGSRKSFAQMDGDEKDRVSHRGRAWRALAELLTREEKERKERDDARSSEDKASSA